MTLPVEVNPTLMYKAASGGYQIPRSLRFRASAPNYLTRLPSSAGNQQKWTLSFWVKRGKLANYNIMFNNNAYSGTYIAFGGAVADTLMIGDYGSGYNYQLVSTQVFRDTSAWYHFVIAFDTTQATASNRLKVYCNGSQITSFQTANYPTLNYNTYWNQTSTHYIGQASDGSPFDGYMTEINFINGQQLDQTSFGETDITTGVWKPKKFSGSYGTNGFYLNFSDNSAATAAAIGKDSSGNGNNWTPNNISVTSGATYDSMIDTPTPYDDGTVYGRGNYCVMPPMIGYSPYAGTTTFSNGNLTLSGSSHNSVGGLSSMPIPRTGKWYAECKLTASGGGDPPIGLFTMLNGQGTPTSYAWFRANGAPAEYSGAVGSISNTGGTTFVVGDTVGIAVDNTGSGQIYFYTNGVLRAQGGAGCNTVDLFFHCQNNSPTFTQFDWNFGQRPFAYTPPSGFKALNTQNLPTPTIVKGNAWMDATTYTGNSSTQNITNSGSFKPDLVWIKSRSAAYGHGLFDSSRGVNKGLQSNNTNAENTFNASVTAFNSDGFALGADANLFVNESTKTFVGWQWKKGATPGFDIVTYTGNGVAGRSVSHGLGVAPTFIIIKRRDVAAAWNIYTTVIDGSLDYFAFDTGAKLDSAQSVPTSSVFYVSNGTNVNANGSTYVAYCWADVSGFSKFGSYTGNGSADGPFVYCGFRPRYLLVKSTSVGSNWLVYDTARSRFNMIYDVLQPNSNAVEITAADGILMIDVLSNGFKLRTADTDSNGSARTFVYAAFAENPFKYALAR